MNPVTFARCQEILNIYKKGHPEMLGVIATCQRLIDTQPFNSLEELFTALVYIINARKADMPAILFFANKLA